MSAHSFIEGMLTKLEARTVEKISANYTETALDCVARLGMTPRLFTLALLRTAVDLAIQNEQRAELAQMLRALAEELER
jgi:hypothetical protein